MMRPQYVRFVISSDKNLQPTTSSQGAQLFRSIRSATAIRLPNLLSSQQTVNAIPPSKPLPARIIIDSKRPTLNLIDEIIPDETNNSMTSASAHETPLKSLISSNDMMMDESNSVEEIFKPNMCKCSYF